MTEFLIATICIIAVPIAIVVGCKPCLFNLREHQWVNRGNVEVCRICGLIKQKAKK